MEGISLLKIHEALIVLSMILIIFSTPQEITSENMGFHVESVILTVYRDGIVHILQDIRVNETIPDITLPILSGSAYNVLAIDENGSVLDYEINGSNITIFTLGATEVTLEYDTKQLTSMKTGVWTIFFKSPYNVTVKLPENAEVIFLSDAPSSINIEDKRIVLSLFPGEWEISYIFPIIQLFNFRVADLRVSPEFVRSGEAVTVSVLVMNVGEESGFYDVVLEVNGSVEDRRTIMLDRGESVRINFTISRDKPGTYIVEIAGLRGKFVVRETLVFPTHLIFLLVLFAAALTFSIILIKWRRKPSINRIFKRHPYLRQEEKEVLLFIAENGGRAFESEIRRRFPKIPRTSLWRLVRRLEREGIVRVRKVGYGNLVELKG